MISYHELWGCFPNFYFLWNFFLCSPKEKKKQRKKDMLKKIKKKKGEITKEKRQTKKYSEK